MPRLLLVILMNPGLRVRFSFLSVRFCKSRDRPAVNQRTTGCQVGLNLALQIFDFFPTRVC